jgi:Na+/proline symporter
MWHFLQDFSVFFGFAYAIEQFTSKIIDPEIFIIISGLVAFLTLYLLFARICKTGQRKKGVLITISSYLLVPIIVLTFPIVFHMTLKSEFFMLYNLIWLFVVGFFITLTVNLENNEYTAD